MARIAPLRVLQARIEARALLWQAGEFASYERAVGPLWDYAVRWGVCQLIGLPEVQNLIDTVFAEVIDDDG